MFFSFLGNANSLNPTTTDATSSTKHPPCSLKKSQLDLSLKTEIQLQGKENIYPGTKKYLQHSHRINYLENRSFRQKKFSHWNSSISTVKKTTIPKIQYYTIRKDSPEQTLPLIHQKGKITPGVSSKRSKHAGLLSRLTADHLAFH